MSGSKFKLIFLNTVPVIAGYVVLGIGFGMIMRANGFGLVPAAAMSLFIYAGSMQYAAIGLLTGGASLLTVAFTTLAVNARHFFYGISMVEAYKDAGRRKPYMVLALTDETYSLVCTRGDDLQYCFWVSVLDHIYWVVGTVLGCLLGNALKINTEGIEFALTALFLVVMTSQWMSEKDHFPALTGLICTAAALLIFGKDSFLIPAMILIAVVLLIRRRRTEEHCVNDGAAAEGRQS